MRESGANRSGPSASMQRGRPLEGAGEDDAVDTPLSSSQSFARSRSVRRRVHFDHLSRASTDRQPVSELASVATPGRPSRTPAELPATPAGVLGPRALEFVVCLPNRTSVEVQVPAEVCGSLTVRAFVKLVKREEKARVWGPEVKRRGMFWGEHVQVRDVRGRPVRDGEFTLSSESRTAKVLLLDDLHPDTGHTLPGFWNVTPEPRMLEVLPRDYTLFSALADELDLSLQAVYQLRAGKKRVIRVNLDREDGIISIFDTGEGMDGTPDNCISEWGTLGSSTDRHLAPEAGGGDPPYLKPDFGTHGFGGIRVGFHLGGSVTVSSTTELSQRVVVLHLGRESLTEAVKSGSLWKSGAEFCPPTEQELQWSPHGSFTKVEISDLNREVSTWRVEEVQRKLKDYYFPYIQNDGGRGKPRTTRPVEIWVNGEDLAGVLGGEVARSHLNSGPGDPFVIVLEFSKLRDADASGHAGGRFDVANARITCLYFPARHGRESIDDVIDPLKEEDPGYAESFETFSRRAIRRLGRLLPNARGGRLPFMEPKGNFGADEVDGRCYQRVKAFIDVDASFLPTRSKMDLVRDHPFAAALLNLGLGVQTAGAAETALKKPGLVAVSIMRWSSGPGHRSWISTDPGHLSHVYAAWIGKQHESFDSGDESSLVTRTRRRHGKEPSATEDGPPPAIEKPAASSAAGVGTSGSGERRGDENDGLFAPRHEATGSGYRAAFAAEQIGGRGRRLGLPSIRNPTVEGAELVERESKTDCGTRMDACAGETSADVECGCCCSHYRFEEMVQCAEGHLFCFACLRRRIEESTFGGSRASGLLPCMDTSGCEESFPWSEVRRVLPPDVFAKYEQRQAEDAVARAKIPGLVHCPFCDTPWVVDPAVGVLECENESCRKASCVLYREPSHLPLRCEEVEKKSETFVRRSIEERMTRALLRVCSACNAEVLKSEGCNKVRCWCGQDMCYVCRQPIDEDVGYRHFCQCSTSRKRARMGLCVVCKKCRLMGTEDSSKTVNAAKESAMEEFAPDDPDLRQRTIGPEMEEGRRKERTFIPAAPFQPPPPEYYNRRAQAMVHVTDQMKHLIDVEIFLCISRPRTELEKFPPREEHVENRAFFFWRNFARSVRPLATLCSSLPKPATAGKPQKRTLVEKEFSTPGPANMTE